MGSQLEPWPCIHCGRRVIYSGPDCTYLHVGGGYYCEGEDIGGRSATPDKPPSTWTPPEPDTAERTRLELGLPAEPAQPECLYCGADEGEPCRDDCEWWND